MSVRRLVALLLLAVAVVWTTTCRESRVATAPTEQTGASSASEPTPRTRAERTEAAFALANDHVESARVLSPPLAPLSSDVAQGIALPAYSELPDLTYEDMLRRIAAVGATHVSIVVSWDQLTIYHNRIAPDPDKNPSDERLKEVIEAAHGLGLQTLLFPIIHVERRAKGEWRGRLAPTDLERWRAEYRDFILHHAKIARTSGAHALCVGSELSSQEDATDWWRALIADVRSIYDGQLIYSANWDHYTHPQFWDDLDYIGVSAYFEVARRNDEPIFKVTERWKRHREELVQFARQVGKPLVLTEVGYPAVDGAAVKPWDYTVRTAANPNAQLAAFRSLTDAWNLPESDVPHFGGLFIWHGWGHGGRDDASYPIWDKSAERLVRQWYGASEVGVDGVR